MKKLLTAIVVLGAAGAAGAFYFRDHAPVERDGVATYTCAKMKFIRHVTAEGNLRAVKAANVNAPSSGSFGPMKIAWVALDGTLVKTGEVVVRFDPSDPEKRLRDGQADLDSADAKLRSERIKSQAAVGSRKADADLAHDELDQQHKFAPKDEQIFSRNQIIEAQVDEGLATAKQDHAEQAKQIEGRLSSSNAAVIDVERKKAQLTINHAQSSLKAMAVTAPNDGIFVLHRNSRGQAPKLGDQVWPGREIGEIPLLDAMEAQVFVLEVDGSGLVEKQAAEVIVEARPDLIYKGTIKLVAKLAEPRQDGSPVQYFAVTIALDKTDRDVMKPGQRVRSTLVLDQEDAIAVPRQAVFDKDGKTFVYRKAARGYEEAIVELGGATSGRVVIKKGLADGDVIALRDPTRAAALGSGSGSASR